MAARPTWQGHLKLSLVTCPVALYAATTQSNDVSFHLINPETNNRIRMVPTDPDTGPVDQIEQWVVRLRTRLLALRLGRGGEVPLGPVRFELSTHG